MFNEIHVYLKSIIDMSELVQQGGQSVVPVRGVLLQSVHWPNVWHRGEQIVLETKYTDK